MAKSPDAFRTIREVAEWLDTPAHVLRFWESRFTQVKPVKRAGGRRYYRPSDMELLGGIKQLLHEDGLTIRGVQKLLREQGVRHVAGKSQPLGVVLEPCAMAGASQEIRTEAQEADRTSSSTAAESDRAGASPAIQAKSLTDTRPQKKIDPNMQDAKVVFEGSGEAPIDRGAPASTPIPPEARATSATRGPYLSALRNRLAADLVGDDRQEALAMATALLDRMNERP